MEGEEWEEGEMKPPLSRGITSLYTDRPIWAPLNPSQARVCVYYTSQETEVPAR